MKKLKGFLVLAAIVFFVAYNPAGAAAAIGAGWSGFLRVVDGAGIVIVRLAGQS